MSPSPLRIDDQQDRIVAENVLSVGFRAEVQFEERSLLAAEELHREFTRRVLRAEGPFRASVVVDSESSGGIGFG